jgi:hypothetical protein
MTSAPCITTGASVWAGLVEAFAKDEPQASRLLLVP